MNRRPSSVVVVVVDMVGPSSFWKLRFSWATVGLESARNHRLSARPLIVAQYLSAAEYFNLLVNYQNNQSINQQVSVKNIWIFLSFFFLFDVRVCICVCECVCLTDPPNLVAIDFVEFSIGDQIKRRENRCALLVGVGQHARCCAHFDDGRRFGALHSEFKKSLHSAQRSLGNQLVIHLFIHWKRSFQKFMEQRHQLDETVWRSHLCLCVCVYQTFGGPIVVQFLRLRSFPVDYNIYHDKSRLAAILWFSQLISWCSFFRDRDWREATTTTTLFSFLWR